MEDVLQIRLSLEALAVRLSCENITPAALQELKVAMEDFEEKTKFSQFVEMAKADVKFHEILYKASNNPKLQQLLSNLREQMYRYRVEYLKDDGIYPRLIEEHQKMYDALKAKDLVDATDSKGGGTVTINITTSSFSYTNEKVVDYVDKTNPDKNVVGQGTITLTNPSASNAGANTSIFAWTNYSFPTLN